MTPRYAKVREIADRFRVSADAVYLWIRQGKIPSDCVIRIAGTIRVDEEHFEQCLRSGALCQPPGKKGWGGTRPSAAAPVSTIARDNLTTVGARAATEHRWSTKTGRLEANPPFSPEMVATEK